MIFGGTKGKRGRIEGDQNAGKYAQRLQMYKIPPTDNITLEEFEEFAIERLKVLRDVETFGIRYKRSSKEYQHAMKESLKKFLPQWEKPPSPEHLEAEEKERRKDHISHFILRLAYCRSEDLRRWFMSQEVELFRFRFVDVAQVYPSEADMFLKSNGLKYKSIKEEERKEKETVLQHSGYNLTIDKVLITDYYKVPFIEALDLVRSRKVYLEDGFAYVPREELVSLVANEFRMRLSRALAVTARALPYLEEDERLLPKLTNLSRQYVGQDYSNKKTTTGAKVTLDQVDGLSRSSFPLCMRQLHSALRENHHLKHGGRLQYGLFIKGIGLSLEEALIFWRMEFTKLMDVDKFEKQHAYNIRHNYGKEGKRQDYTPYSCMKIIMSNPPGPGDHHGCPFRHTDADLLRQRLAAYRVAKKGIDEIMEFVKDSHYQLACTRYYELTHGVSATSAINHPNQYFEESRQATQEGHGGTTRVGGATPSSLSHGRVAVKKEVTTTTPDVDMSGDLGDFRMDDDDDEILGEIEGIEKAE